MSFHELRSLEQKGELQLDELFEDVGDTNAYQYARFGTLCDRGVEVAFAIAFRPFNCDGGRPARSRSFVKYREGSARW